MREQNLRKTVREGVIAKMREVAELAGVESRLMHGIQSDDSLIYVIKFAPRATMVADVNQIMVAAGLPEDTNGRTYEHNGHTHTVIDAVTTMDSVKIRVLRDDGVVFKIGVHTLQVRLGLIEPDPEFPEADEIETPGIPVTNVGTA